MESKEQDVALYAKIGALELLVRLLVSDAQRRDPQFAERCRNTVDTVLGAMLVGESILNHVDRWGLSPPLAAKAEELRQQFFASAEIREQTRVKMREMMVAILEAATTSSSVYERQLLR